MRKNDLQLMVEEMAEEYVALVRHLLATVAPNGPWWTSESSEEERVLMWLEMRDEALAWLELIDQLGVPNTMQGELPGTRYAHIFTDPDLPYLIPPEVAAAVPQSIRQTFIRGGIPYARRFIDNAEKAARAAGFEPRAGAVAEVMQGAVPA